jgi:eukaryotic-like serine/threonine-protein kinase
MRLHYDGRVAHAGELLTPGLELLRPLGEGGMGEVWVAHHAALGTEVAVKLLRQLDDPAVAGEAQTRFLREARAAAQIGGPYVVQVFDAGISPDGRPFIVMELLRGEDLSHRIASQGWLALDETITLIGQLASALSRAHAVGVIHRDIKPANLFLVDVGGPLHLKVLDFGVVKKIGATDPGLTSTTATVGTPYYMSLEQLTEPRRVDQRADLWSAAIVVYVCLTGTLPFQGETMGALSIAMHRGEFTPPTQLRPGLPPAIDAWMRRAFDADLDRRFQSARELAQTLAETLGEALRRAPAPDAGAPTEAAIASPPPPQGPRAASPPPAQGSPLATLPSPVAALPPAPRSGTSPLVLALVAVLGLVALGSLGAVGYLLMGREGAEAAPLASASTAAPESSSRSKKQRPKPDYDLATVEAPKLFPKVQERVRAARPDAELVGVTASQVDADGRLIPGQSSLTFEFRSLAISSCIYGTLNNLGVLVQVEGLCTRQKVVRPPRCTLIEVRQRVRDTMPAVRATMIYMLDPEDKVRWMVSVPGKDAIVFDDCL